MNEYNFTNPRYTYGTDVDGNALDTPVNICVEIDNQTIYVPLSPANRHYAEIMRQVEAGTLVIAEAE